MYSITKINKNKINFWIKYLFFCFNIEMSLKIKCLNSRIFTPLVSGVLLWDVLRNHIYGVYYGILLVVFLI